MANSTQNIESVEKLGVLYQHYASEKRAERTLRRHKVERRLLGLSLIAVLILIFCWPILSALLQEWWSWGAPGYKLPHFPGDPPLSKSAHTLLVTTVLIIGGVLYRTRNRTYELQEHLDRVASDRAGHLIEDQLRVANYIQTRRFDAKGFRESARRHRRAGNVLQLVVIAGSLGAATLSGAAAPDGWREWSAVALAGMVSFAASTSSFFKFRERSISLDQAGSDIVSELNAHDLKGGRYRRITHDNERSAELMEEIERILADLRQREAALGSDPNR